MPRLYGERWTAEMVRAFPEDGKRYEVIDGELLVTPAPKPPHQGVVGEIFLTLAPWVRAHGIGVTMMSPADIGLEAGGLVQPDVYVMPPTAEGKLPAEWHEISRLILAVEVLSRSTARHDRGRKRELFSRVGVPEYWIVDPKRRLIERWRPGDAAPELCNRTLEWRPDGASDALVIDVAEMFRTALRE